MAQGEEAVSSQEEPLREARTITSRPRGRTGVHPEDLYEAFDRIGRESADLRGDMAAQIRRIDEVVAGSPHAVAAGPTAPEAPRRTWLGWVLGLGVVAAAIWGLSQCSGTASTSSATPSASGSAVVGPSPSNAASVSTSVAASVPPSAAVSPSAVSPSAVSPSTAVSPSVAAATVPMAWGGATVLTPPGLVATGPGVSSPGSDVAYVADADGTSFDVFQRVRLAQPSTSVTLAMLAPATPLVPELASLPLSATGLQVELDGHAVTPTRQGATWTVRSNDGAAFSGLVLRYRLTDAVTQIRPTQTGRYSALLTPLLPGLTAGSATTTPSVVHVSGTQLRSLTCPLNPPRTTLCGQGPPSGLSANLAAGTPPLLQLAFDR